MPTATVEDYLKTLFKLQQRGNVRVKTKQVAEALDISLPSVTAMLKHLSAEGYVDYESYRGASLTSDGRLAALRVVRNHRLIEVFLVEVLGYHWDEVHAEAERLEHAMSEQLTNRIDAFLGYPRVDPHGDPIPGPDGDMQQPVGESLLHVQPPCDAVVKRVLDQASDVLQYLGEQGLRPGAAVRVVRFDPFDGPVWLEVDGRSVALSRSLAARLVVEVTDHG